MAKPLSGAGTQAPISWKARIAIVVWFALVTSLGEMAILTVRKFGLGAILHRGPDYGWMIPLVNITIFLVLAAILGLATKLGPIVQRIEPGVYTFLAISALLFMFPAMSLAAVLLLALGVGVQLTRIANRHRDGFQQFTRRTLPVPALLLVILAVFTAWSFRKDRGSPGDSTAPAGAPNILLIVLDTVRDLNLSLYGYSRPTSPVLDSLSRNGVFFNHAWASAPWTLPSHASIFTGLPAEEHGADWHVPLSGRYQTIAELLSNHGYATGGFAANTLYVSEEHGLAQGFQHYVAYAASPGETIYSASLLRRITDNPLFRRITGYHDILGRLTAEEINEKLLAWLPRDRERPFFAFLNYFDAHEPLLPPRPFDTLFTSDKRHYLAGVSHWNHQAGFPQPWALSPDQHRAEQAVYDGAIRYMDGQIGQLLRELHTRGLLDNTIVIISSDHGESFGEHGVYSHGNSLYPEVLEVPLLIVAPGDTAPGRFPSGLRINQPIALSDLGATIADLAGVPLENLAGHSLRGYWNDSTFRSPTPIVAHLSWDGTGQPRRAKLEKGMRSLVRDGLQYILNSDGSEELFRVGDRVERANLAKDPGFVTQLEEMRSALRQVTTPAAR